MKLQVQNDVLKISDVRELGAGNATAFRDQVRAALDARLKAVEIDLSKTAFLDSCGLGALIAILKSARNLKASVRLINPTPAIQQILEMTRLHRMFEVVLNLECEPIPPSAEPANRASSDRSGMTVGS